MTRARERGQATLEYVLMLTLALSMAILVMKNLIRPAVARLNQVVVGAFNNALFQGDLHHLPFHRGK